jgi:hypothetical protein
MKSIEHIYSEKPFLWAKIPWFLPGEQKMVFAGQIAALDERLASSPEQVMNMSHFSAQLGP